MRLLYENDYQRFGELLQAAAKVVTTSIDKHNHSLDKVQCCSCAGHCCIITFTCVILMLATQLCYLAELEGNRAKFKVQLHKR